MENSPLGVYSVPMELTLTEKLAPNEFVRAYTFTSNEPITFVAGQFFRLLKKEDAVKEARAFSAANAPNGRSITFLMKHLTDGVISGFLDQAPVGTTLTTIGPFGKFVLDPQDEARVFIAAGTGLAPIISFLESDAATPTQVLFGVHDEAHLFWTEKLPRGALVTISHPTNAWNGVRGRVTDYLERVVTDKKNTGYYLCGSPDMVTDVRAKLLQHGVAAHYIHFEIY